ncbi:hypothetical protein KX524_26495 [Escherichia coli]|nr:hypothetical protein [Escherichia coli]
MKHYEKIAFEEANPDIVAQQQAVRDETLDEYISRFVTHCRDNGYYTTENSMGDFRYHSELKGVANSSINAMYRGFLAYADHTGYKGAYPKETFSKVKHALERGLTFATETFFEPGAPAYLVADASLGMYRRNTWKPFQYSGKKTIDGKAPNLDIFFERTCRLFGNKADHVLDMLAFAVQYPGKRLPQFLYLVGNQGAGKGTYFTWYIMPLFAPGQAKKTKDLPVGRFDGADYATKEFVFFDDPVSTDKDRQRLKSILTESYMDIEPKYETQRGARMYFNTVLVCNPDQMFPILEEDRRPYVVISPNNLDFDWPVFRENVELPELLRCGEDPDDPRQHGAYIDALHDYFMKRPVDFNEMMHPITTDDHLVVANMVSPVENAILDAAELFSVVGCSKLQEVIDYDKNRLPTHNTIGAVLKRHGWVEVRVRFNDREKPRAYYNPSRFPDKPSQEQLRRAYNLEYYELGEVNDPSTEITVDQSSTLPSEAPVLASETPKLTGCEEKEPVFEAKLTDCEAPDFEPPEDLSAAFENDEPDANDCKESYMIYIPDDYMSEDFRKRLTSPKNETQGFWMYVNGVKTWYDSTAGSGEKPVEIIPDNQLPVCMCAPRDDLPPARGLSVDAANTSDYLVWDAENDCWQRREPLSLH